MHEPDIAEFAHRIVPIRDGQIYSDEPSKRFQLLLHAARSASLGRFGLFAGIMVAPGAGFALEERRLDLIRLNA